MPIIEDQTTTPTIWGPPDGATMVAPPSIPPSRAGGATTSLQLMLVAIAALGVSLFLPFVTLVAPLVGRIDLAFIQAGDGPILGGIVLALGALLAWEWSAPSRTAKGLLLLGMLAAAALLAVDFADAQTRIADINSDGFGRGTIGIGGYMAGAAVLGALGCWLAHVSLDLHD